MGMFVEEVELEEERGVASFAEDVSLVDESS